MSIQLPIDLMSSLQLAPGFDELRFEEVHAAQQVPVSVRFNARKGVVSPDLPCDTNVPWCTHGYYLAERPSFTSDPLFHAGAYYVQEASSMFLEEALRQTCDPSQPLKVLDLCAAPGGKSTLIQSFISPASILVSNEVIKSRVGILQENLVKWGAQNVVVTNNDPADFKRLPAYFDVVVVDAPCSGSGLFRKDPAAISEWSLQQVSLCSKRQQRILDDVMGALKPGGILIYSTCSYSREEDEEIAAWLENDKGMASIRLSLKTEWNIVETVAPGSKAYGYRFYPDKVRGEGFFIAAFTKLIASEQRPQKSTGKILPAPGKAALDAIHRFVNSSAAEQPYIWKDEVLLMSELLAGELALLRENLYVRKAGVNAGSLIRQELIPSHELAMSNLLAPNIPSVEVDKENALQFLRRAELELDIHTKGWVLIRYLGLPIGWVKSMPGRMNNYYPKEWRILNK